MHTRGSKYVLNFELFNVFIIRQAHLLPKVPKQANFQRFLQNLPADIDFCANILALRSAALCFFLFFGAYTNN